MPDAAMLRCERLVVGGGVCGLAALDALHEQGVEALLVEQGAPGGAQSAGLVRIFRLAHEDPQLVERAWRSRDLWRAWEQRLGVQLLAPAPLLVAGDGAVQRAASLRERGGTVRPAADVPGVAGLGLAALGEVLVDVHAGAILAQATVEALAAAHGARILGGEAVLSLARRGAGFRAQTRTRLIDAEGLVVAAGAGTPELAAQLGIDLEAGAQVHLRATFELSEQRQLPCLIDHSGRIGVPVYGTPIPGTPRFVLGGSGADPAAGEAAGSSDAMLDALCAYAAAAFAPLRVELVALRSCEAVTLPGVHDGFLLREEEGVRLVAGPNLFKFAPLIGQLLARPSRFGRAD